MKLPKCGLAQGDRGGGGPKFASWPACSNVGSKFCEKSGPPSDACGARYRNGALSHQGNRVKDFAPAFNHDDASEPRPGMAFLQLVHVVDRRIFSESRYGHARRRRFRAG
jgi:hypothetical protein